MNNSAETTNVSYLLIELTQRGRRNDIPALGGFLVKRCPTPTGNWAHPRKAYSFTIGYNFKENR